MRYKLFLDDVRYPPINSHDWRIARNYDDATWYVRSYGIPYHISFDHDLAWEHYTGVVFTKEYTGLDFAKWFCYYILDNDLQLPTDFTYFVHSQNPVGAANITSFMESFLKDGYVE